jgi:DNA-binding GntR family transcriptional regulator
MQKSGPLERATMRQAVAGAVRAMILDGRLAEGERVNEVRLAQSLGVSRTPLREALCRLAAEGALSSTVSHGYSVRPLTLEEFEQTYDIRPILDPEALRIGGVPSLKRLDSLERLNRSFAAARDPEVAIALDDRWHLELLLDCPNRVLIELIEGIMLRTRRYELALMREGVNVERAGAQHARILTALRQNDLPAACAALKHNMQSGRAPIVAWLVARNDSAKET